MREVLVGFYNDIAKKKAYWLPLFFFAVLAYGFSVFNRTMSIDSLSMEHHIGDEHALIEATRWGMVLWVKLFSRPIVMPFVRKFLAVVFMMCGATVFSATAYFLLKVKNVWTYTIFSSTIVVYPLINEIFEYDIANIAVGGNLLLVALAVLFFVSSDLTRWKKIVISAGFLLPVASGYEAGIFVYITAVFILLFCKYVIVQESKNKITLYLAEGLGFAIPLLFAVVLRIVIGIFLIKLYGLKYFPNGDTTIAWFQGTTSFVDRLLSLFNATVNSWFLFSFAYLPITIFFAAFMLFIIIVIRWSIRQRRVLPLISGVGVIFSLFLLAIIQGQLMNYRAAQNMTLFVAFVVAFVLEGCLRSKYRGIRYAALIGSVWLCLQQSTCLNQFLALNNQRSDNEIAVVRQIGYNLKSSYEDKPVVFVGEYDLGSWIEQQVSIQRKRVLGKCYDRIRFYLTGSSGYKTRFLQTNVNSVLTWSVGIYNQQRMKDLFSYCGYDITTKNLTDGALEEYTDIAKQENMKPLEIRDMGNYILVCLGKLDE